MLLAGLFGTATAAQADPSPSLVVPVAVRSAIAPVPAVNRGPFWENADCYAAGNAEMKTGKYTGFECTGSLHSWVCHLHEKPANPPLKHPVTTLPLERELQQPAPKAAPEPTTPLPTPRSSVAENVRKPEPRSSVAENVRKPGPRSGRPRVCPDYVGPGTERCLPSASGLSGHASEPRRDGNGHRS
jgi:hypothetical protein